jgi:rubrerythrin
MKDIETDDEILEFAITREQQANEFFLALAEVVKSKEMRRVFEELAEEELEHKAKLELEAIKKGVVVNTVEKGGTFDISDYVISDEPELDMDYRDMLLLGVEKEDASFRLYVDLIPHAKDKDSKETLLALAQEEVKHKLRFEMELENLSREK